jgi:hypothetical protein
MSAIQSEELKVKNEKSAIGFQPTGSGGQRMPPSQFRTPPPRPVAGTNSIFRAGGPGARPLVPAEFQKAQELPEVKAAKDAFMEAQKKYVSTMQAAMGGKPEARGQRTEIRDQRTEVSGQKAGSSNQYSVNSGQKK